MKTIQIENIPSEIGEETALDNRDDGTITSKILGSTVGLDVLRAMEAKIEYAALGMETESKSLEELSHTDNESESDEREFDKNPTVLYALVQKKLWKEAIARAKSNPREARAFISRKEKNGRIRWRLLPLHAAIVFKSPEAVIEALLTSYPKAAEAKDDQGMLPLHLAFRNNATEGVVNLLLLAFPKSVDTPDRKGRVPLSLAKAASSPKRELYIRALKKGPSHYAVTATACARERIVAEQKLIFEAKLKQAREFHECAIVEMEASAEKKQNEIQDTVHEKERELAKIHENSQVLVDHVASLEAQMNTRSDTERFLATKISKLEEKLKESDVYLKERETFWKNTVANMEGRAQETQGHQEEGQRQFTEKQNELNATIEALSAELGETKTDLSSTQAKLAHSIDYLKEKQGEWDVTELKSKAQYSRVELDWANSQADVAIFNSQLKKRMDNEHLLASQVSSLAARLAECATSNINFAREANDCKEQNTTLETTVHLLTKRINNVTAIMENTREQQMSILNDAISQEEMMAQCMENHARVVTESLAQGNAMQEAKNEMMAMIERSFDEANEKRIISLNVSTEQGRYLSNMNTHRCNLLSSAQTVTSNVICALEKDLNLDTLSMELENIEAEKKEGHRTIVGFHDEVDEIKAKETPTESSTAPKEETTEYVEVFSSPMKSLNTIIVAADASATEVEEERRTEVDEKGPEEIASIINLNVDRVPAE